MYKLVRPAIFKMDPEKAHDIALWMGKHSGNYTGKLINSLYGFSDDMLHTNVLGMDFENPVGLAAGFDKNGELIDLMPNLGFGHTEIGSVTARGGDGNEKPRVFRLPEDEAIINRMGLNNEGAYAVYNRLSDREFEIPVGMNITKTNDPTIVGDNAIGDFCGSFGILYPIGDYMTINISCPNTEDGKTFENDPAALCELLHELMKMKSNLQGDKPVLVKISPDITYEHLDRILDVSEDQGVDGYVMCNTSSGREGLRTEQEVIDGIGNGGLSGLPIRKKSIGLIKHVYEHLNNLTIIGVGGISSAEDAYESIKAGASLVQILTGLIYHGPGLPKEINRGLVELLKRDGISSVGEAVGKWHDLDG